MCSEPENFSDPRRIVIGHQFALNEVVPRLGAVDPFAFLDSPVVSHPHVLRQLLPKKLSERSEDVVEHPTRRRGEIQVLLKRVQGNPVLTQEIRQEVMRSPRFLDNRSRRHTNTCETWPASTAASSCWRPGLFMSFPDRPGSLTTVTSPRSRKPEYLRSLSACPRSRTLRRPVPRSIPGSMPTSALSPPPVESSSCPSSRIATRINTAATRSKSGSPLIALETLRLFGNTVRKLTSTPPGISVEQRGDGLARIVNVLGADQSCVGRQIAHETRSNALQRRPAAPGNHSFETVGIAGNVRTLHSFPLGCYGPP